MRDIVASVVIVTWNSKHLIGRCLSPFDPVRSSFDVLVYDNNSADGTCDYVRENFPWVRVFQNSQNIGFGRANNAAFSYCRGEYILLLNPDAFLDEQGTAPISSLAAHLDSNSNVAAVGPQLVHEDGRHQVGDAGWATSLTSVAGHSLGLHRAFRSWPSIYISNATLLRQDYVSLDWICGACMMVRKSIIREVGGFSDKIFMYGEDVEWGERIKKRGCDVHYLPSIKVLHVQGGTQKVAGPYFSTKWLDARATRFSEDRTSLEFAAFRFIFFTGFLAKAFSLSLIGIFYKSRRQRAWLMLKYAAYSIQMPSTK